MARRELVEKGIRPMAASEMLSQGTSARSAAGQSGVVGMRRLRAFDYDGVQLTGGMLKGQLERTRELHLSIPDDDILRAFRKRAGLYAPGNDLGGIASEDASTTFGQWISGVARISKATGDRQLRDKAQVLVRGWAEAFEHDGRPFLP
jgi:uncharacterized protein